MVGDVFQRIFVSPAFPKKSLFEYDNFREFLRDFYRDSKTRTGKFSLGYFSRVAGFKSRSVLRQVMSGERNIGPDSIEKFVRALRLTREEGRFFRNLVLLNQAKSQSEKQKYAEEIFKSKKYRETNPLRESQFNYFSHWYYVVIREMAFFDDFRADPEWIARRVQPNIKVTEAKQALEELIQLGFLQKGADGKLHPSEAWLSTTDEVTSTAIIQYHLAMLSRAGESIQRFSRDRRDISAQTFAVSGETAKVIKEMIQNFRRDIEAVASQDRTRDTVYQLNFQLFPIALADEE